MVAAGEKSTPNATLKLLSQHTAAPQEKTPQRQELLKRYDSQPPEKVVVSEGKQQLLTHHGLRHQQHVPCDSPVRFLMFWEAAAAFISLHSDQTVRLHKANGHRQTLSACLPFAGLTATEIPGCLVGWGPGPVFTLLDSQLRPLDTADSALDIQLCESAEHSKELVSAGAGNVCVWSVMLMRRRVTVQEGLGQYGAFSHMALAAPRPGKPQRGFFASGQNVVVVDLDGGRVLEHKERLCPRNITTMVYCSQLDCLIISSEDLAITVWDSDWKLHVVFLGHTAVVTSLFYCSELNILVSSSADCTIRIWNVEGCDTIDCVKTKTKRPPLYIRGTKKGDTFLTVSHKGIDFWAFRNLYTLHCQLGRENATLRQIVVPQLPASYPTRVLCISGDRNISLLAEETGAVLTCYEAKEKILCADYLLQKEILLALTEAGTVLQANTLSNPITLMQEWTGVGQGPWQPTDHVTKKDAKKLPVPGPACCLVLYSSVADTQRALEEWRSLQGERGSSHRKYMELNDAKNKFLIIIGQSRGCVSVLKSDNGNVLFRIPAHSGQRVTTMQAYPEDHCLLSSGEDLTVVLWRVYPHIKECLTQQLSVPCDQPQICFAALGSQMALSFQEPSSGSYRLRFFSLHNQTVYQPKEGHSDNLTGLCVIPEVKLLVSISLDRTMQVWNEENQLIRTLQLQAVPQCLAYSCSGGQLYLGIGGDLFKMRCAKFLPTNYREMLCCSRFSEPHPDEPIAVIKETFNQTNMSKLEEEILQAITNNRLLIGGMRQQASLLSSNMDLEVLLQSSVKCQKGKPPSTKQTQKEAFGNYMNILYGLKPIDKTELEDMFDPAKYTIYPKATYFRPHHLPKIKEETKPKRKKEIPVIEEKKKKRKVQKTPVADEPQPVERVIPKEPVIVKKPVRFRKPEEPVPEIIQAIEEPKPRTPPPAPPPPRTPIPPPPPPPAPPPPREPSPEVPTFLKQFAQMEWFTDVYPDKKAIPDDLTPEDFCLKLLSYLQTCCVRFRMEILSAFHALHQQGLLPSTDRLYTGLINSLQKFAKPNMSPLECGALTQMLYLLKNLKSKISFKLMKTLLALLASQEPELRKAALRLLRAAGVDEAEDWLLPELERWQPELQDQSNTWANLHGKADFWLEMWITKFKKHNPHLDIGTTDMGESPAFSLVDVLNYFCSVQREEHRKATRITAYYTVTLPLGDNAFKPILRLGETYSMDRIRRPLGIILPPLRKRPLLMRIPNFITLPLPRITLQPFHIYSEGWLKASARRYFILQQSLVEYYRRSLKY